jgi:hypothetical protein
MLGGYCQEKPTRKSAKTKTPKKAAKRSPTKKKPAGSPARGGGFADDLSKLAIPLGLIATNQVLQHVTKRGRSGKSSKPKSGRSKPSMRGGNDGMDGTQMPMGDMSDAFPISGGSAQMAAPPTSPFMDNASMVGATVGGAAAQRHAMVAREFRRMAKEIGSFLRRDSRSRSASTRRVRRS